MVSNARLDFPEPERPVITTNLLRGMVSEIFFRLCSRAPLIEITLSLINTLPSKADYQTSISKFYLNDIKDTHVFARLTCVYLFEVKRPTNQVLLIK